MKPRRLACRPKVRGALFAAVPESWVPAGGPYFTNPVTHPDTIGDSWTRHLCYHVFPVAGNGVWQQCVAELLPHLPLFNGRRLVSIMTDRGGRYPLDPPEAVEETLAGHGCEFARLRNDSTGEVVSWAPMVSALREYAGPQQAMFWSHAKGVTKPAVATAQEWRRVMLETSLGDWPTVRDTLIRHYVAGSFFMGRFYKFPWHYSGCMFWTRLTDLFATARWRDPPRRYGGVEFHACQLWPDGNRAGKLFHSVRPGRNLYDESYWQEFVRPDLEAWRLTHTGCAHA